MFTWSDSFTSGIN